MTKQEFLDGKTFKIGCSLYRYKHNDDLLSSYIYTGFYNRNNGKFIDMGHEANIEKVGNTTAHCYSYVLGKRVDIKLKYSELC